jgi:glycosyltransferase involved in cell wall biosynthesis
MTRLVFIAKDARWQKYRNDILFLLAEKYEYSIHVLTCGKIENQILESTKLKYHSFLNLMPAKWKISFFPGAFLYLIKERPEAMLAINNISQLTEYFSFILCRMLGIKFIWWTHAYDHGPNRTMLKNKTLRHLRTSVSHYFLKKSDTIITFSEEGKNYLVDCGISGKKIFCAPNTLNTQSMFELYRQLESDNSRSKLKEFYGLPSDASIVLFCGRLQKRKSIDLLIKAFSTFENNRYYLLIVGDGPERFFLEALSEKLKVKNVRFLGEIYDEKRLSQVFFISSIFVMPGAIGLSIVQAFSYRLPVITLEDLHHGPEIQYFEKDYNGFMLKKGDYPGIAKKINELFSNKKLLEDFSANAFLTAQNKCNINETLKEINNAISYALFWK